MSKRRVHIESDLNTAPMRLVYEVTRTAIDEEAEQFGRPRADDYSYEVELISGDVEALSDLENEEAELAAIEQAKSEWTEVAKLEGAA